MCVCICIVFSSTLSLEKTHHFYKTFSYWLLNPLLFPILQYSKTLCILTVKVIIHILFTSPLNYYNSFLTGILCFYLWFTGHTAAILLRVMLLSEYFPTQNLHCLLCKYQQTCKAFIVCLQDTFLAVSFSTHLCDSIRTHSLQEFPFTYNCVFLCLLQQFLPICICRSRCTQIRKWFFNIRFTAVLQLFVTR